MDKGKSEIVVKTGRGFKQWLIQRAHQKKISENGGKKENHVTEEEEHVSGREVTGIDAHRVDDQREREKQTCSSEKNGSKQEDNFIAYECKSSTSKFVEYWVPVKLSYEQIEQYCACLFSNSAWLCSCLKEDSPSFLHDILVSSRKCCDHPYLEDRSLRDTVIKGIPLDQHLDTEIKLSGKLELLNKILQEIKQQGQRVLILFRSLGRSGFISIGDILDDFIDQKFGVDSYMLISRNVAPSKKKAALNKFNKKESGFACLMETRDCSASVKLSGIDTIILFNSDWDPTNDLRSLQKISIDSQLEHIKVFRLYSCFTVEEKALILAKQGLPIDSNISNIKQADCHELLTWSASYLFHVLDCSHVQSSDSKKLSEVAALDDVSAELLALISNNSENSDYNSRSKILKVQQNGGTYTRNIFLLGELEMQLMSDSSFLRGMMGNKPPNIFWTNLLHGRVPNWKHLPNPSQGIRRKVRLGGNLHQISKWEQVSERNGRKEGNRFRLTEPRLRMKRKLPVQGKRHKLGIKRKVRLGGDLHQLSRGEQVSEKKASKEGNKVDLTPEPKLRMKRKLPVQGKRHKLGTSHLSAGNKHKCRRLVTNPSSVQSNQLQDANMSASTDRDQAHAFVPADNHQSHRNCVDSSNHQVLDSVDLQLDWPNWPINSSIQQSTGNLPLQQNTSIGAVNDASMRSRNNQEDQCHPDTSPNAPELLPQSPLPHPLQMMMERIQKEREQITKLHEDVKLHLRSEFERELDAVAQKYDLLLQIAEMELVPKQKDLDMRYQKVQVHKFLAELLMIQTQNSADRAESLEMMEGTGQSSPSRPTTNQAGTASTQAASQSSNVLNYPSLISEPANSEQQAVDAQVSSENFPVAATPSQNAELPIVTQSAAVPLPSLKATLQTESFANLPTLGSLVTPTRNLHPVFFTPVLSTSLPSQLSIQPLVYAARPGAYSELRRPAPHLRHISPLPKLKVPTNHKFK